MRVPRAKTRLTAIFPLSRRPPWAQVRENGGTRSPARFSPPRGRGGGRGVASHRGRLAGPPEGVGAAGVGPGAAVGRLGAMSGRNLGPEVLAWADSQLGPGLELIL